VAREPTAGKEWPATGGCRIGASLSNTIHDVDEISFPELECSLGESHLDPNDILALYAEA